MSSASPQIEIRQATADDAELIYAMICELADYEKLRHEVVATPENLRQQAFGPKCSIEVLVAETDGEAVGFALFFATFSTFLARQGIYLEDLYVREAFRGRGVGKQLLRHIARLAVARGCGRVEWAALDWNAPAIGFYRQIGAESLDEWIPFRLSGEALNRFAARD